MKEFRFVNKQSLKEFNALPRKIQERFAADLNEICKGKLPYSAFKHIASSVGVGAIELIENGRPAYRTVYVAKHKQMVYVLHTFTKTTNGVDRKAMATARQRYKIMVADLQK
ncbi:type II toxin-antitoxin system RelE/ParE family toxin [Porticoccaceae bacterium]|jgi:phage-related protein|nr:type II toxin-antitoxin system RelE/ParE family toxin [Porticoccaceae bacterium]MDB4076880.1 type II toxin-antitoxin system RelE/ParE family toxin [Porticoccaceae bacterium]MDC0003425.1 type II toxin-antitoxin system RelE/ParE family toxin [Porticoccaceae bacterium]